MTDFEMDVLRAAVRYQLEALSMPPEVLDARVRRGTRTPEWLAGGAVSDLDAYSLAGCARVHYRFDGGSFSAFPAEVREETLARLHARVMGFAPKRFPTGSGLERLDYALLALENSRGKVGLLSPGEIESLWRVDAGLLSKEDHLLAHGALVNDKGERIFPEGRVEEDCSPSFVVGP